MDFIEKIKNCAIKGYKEYGVLPSITIAQAILESGWGKSELATNANNLFGIKASNDWKGQTYTVRTAEYDKNNKKYYINAPFRKYASIDDSILDHSAFFTSTNWRKDNYAKFLNAKDYRTAAREIQNAGYATSQEYANQLIDLIERYSLNKYDDIKTGGRKMKIFVSVGHSILKGGACTSADGFVNEYAYNKALAPYVKEAIEDLGHACDIVICPEYTFTSKNQEAAYKLPIANKGGYDLVAELHLNSAGPTAHGSECFYYPGDTKGKAIADRFCRDMETKGFTNRGAKTQQLYMIYETKPTAVLFESFFCDNQGDYSRSVELGYKSIAESIAYALTGDKSKKQVSKPSVKISATTTKKGGYFVLTNTPGDILNVRQMPTADSKIVSSYRHGSKIYVHDIIHGDGTWYKVEYHKGTFGYVSAKYCKGIK